jgi:hypothetical protein
MICSTVTQELDQRVQPVAVHCQEPHTHSTAQYSSCSCAAPDRRAEPELNPSRSGRTPNHLRTWTCPPTPYHGRCRRRGPRARRSRTSKASTALTLSVSGVPRRHNKRLLDGRCMHGGVPYKRLVERRLLLAGSQDTPTGTRRDNTFITS